MDGVYGRGVQVKRPDDGLSDIRVVVQMFEQLCEVVADRPGQDSRYWLDSSAIKKDVGWQPEVELEEGIKEMAEWGKKYLDQLKDWPMDYTLHA